MKINSLSVESARQGLVRWSVISGNELVEISWGICDSRSAVRGNGSARDSIREWMNGLKSGGLAGNAGGEQTIATMKDIIEPKLLRLAGLLYLRMRERSWNGGFNRMKSQFLIHLWYFCIRFRLVAGQCTKNTNAGVRPTPCLGLSGDVGKL